MKQRVVPIFALIFFVLGLSYRFFLTGPMLLDPIGDSERLLTSTTIEKIIHCSQGNVISLDDSMEESQNIASDIALSLALYVLLMAETDAVIMPESLIDREANWFSGDIEWTPPQPIAGDAVAFVSIRESSEPEDGCLADKFSVKIR